MIQPVTQEMNPAAVGVVTNQNDTASAYGLIIGQSAARRNL